MGNLGEVKQRAKNALHALGCQKKSAFKNDHATRDFNWTDERVAGQTATRYSPLRDVDPALGETTGGEQVWSIYQEMLAARAKALDKINVSGNYVTGADKYDQFCAFAQLGGGSVTDQKVLYMLIRWADVDFSRLTEVAVLPGQGAAGLGAEENRAVGLVENQEGLDQQAIRIRNKKRKDRLESQVAETNSLIQTLASSLVQLLPPPVTPTTPVSSGVRYVAPDSTSSNSISTLGHDSTESSRKLVYFEKVLETAARNPAQQIYDNAAVQRADAFVKSYYGIDS